MALREQWRDIRGYTGKYQVSSFGRVRSLERYVRNINGIRRVHPKMMAIFKHVKGYRLVELCKDSKEKMHTVHRLVAKAFHKNPKRKPEVNHLDGDKSNNYKNNLAWATTSENALHAWKTGLNKRTIHKAREKC